MVFHVGFSVAPTNIIAEHLTAMNVFHRKLVIICAVDETRIVVFCLVSPNLIFNCSATLDTTKSKCGHLFENI